MTVSKFLFGTGLESEIRVGFPLMDLVTDREDGEGSEYIDVPDGSIDTWRQNKMFTMQAEARWIPDGPGTNPVQTQLSGPVSWEEFVDWARDGRALRFVPDENVPDFYVDNTYLVEPRKGFGSLSPDIKRNVPIKLRNPAKSFHEAMRGIMFEYAPGTSLTDPNLATFVRATAATRRGVPGTLMGSPIGASEIANVLRDRHYEGTLRTTLLEMLRVQLVTDPENFNNWVVIAGTPTRASGQADPFGGTAAYLITDDDAVNVEGIKQTVTFTADGEKCIAVFIKQGTAASNYFGLRDTTAGVDRHRVIVTWTAGVPSVAVNAGGGTIFTPINWGGGWWLCAISVLGVVAANTNSFEISPTNTTGASTGTAFFFGANAWNATFPSSYQGPNLTTRNADSLDYSFPYSPQPMFVLLDWIDRGLALGSSGNSFVAEIGNTFNDGRIIIDGGSSFTTAYHQANGASVQSQMGAVAYGDRVQALLVLRSDGSVQLKRAVNLGTESAAAQSGALAFRAAGWNPQKIQFYGGTTLGHAVVRAKVGILTLGGQNRDTIARAVAA